MRFKFLTAIVLSCLPLVWACGSESGGGGSGGAGGAGGGSGGAGGQVNCTLEARASVNVKVVDAQGMAVTDAVVTFSVNGGADEMAECVNPVGGMGTCQEWVAGWERDGNFTVTATSADGMKTATQMVTVTKDACHVQPQSVTLTLQ